MAAIKNWLSGKRMPVFEARQGPSGHWHVVKIAGNGEIEDTSENYGGPLAKDGGRQGARRAAKRKAEQIPGAKWRVRESRGMNDPDGQMHDNLG